MSTAVTIRSLRPEDISHLKRMHARMGFQYPFPDLRISDIGKVAADDQNLPIMAALAVPIPDCYLLVDPEVGTPGEKLHTLISLQEAMRAELKERGYRWAQADIPPQIERSFGKRLKAMGWVRSEWPAWATQI